MENEDLVLGAIPKNNHTNEDLVLGAIRTTGPAANYNALFTTPVSLTGGTGLGDSMFDKNIPFSQLGNLAEIRAQRQPWIAKAGAGIARVGTKALTEIAKMPGVLGGIVAGAVGQIGDLATGEDNTDFMQTAFNNTWITGLNDINEQVNKELLPVYVRKAVEEGNLWDNISSIDFWATEGADGLGYIASMLAPGALINKFNIGAKIAGINKFAKIGDKMDEAVNVLGKLKMSPQNANLTTATLANTLFESGAEAQGAMESFTADLDYKLSSGEITQQEYDSQIGRASEVGRNVFVANAAILIGPNAIMAKMLWGKPRNKGLNIIGKKGEKGFEEMAERTLKQKIGSGAKTFGLGAAREGFWEEGMQSTAEQYFTKQGQEEPSKGFMSEFFGSIGDLPRAYAEMVSETEGQKAIFLGAAFGGTMNVGSDYAQKKKEVEATNKIVKVANKALDDFYTIFKGSNFKENPDANDLDGFVKKLIGFQGMETMDEMYNFAVETGNTSMIEMLRNVAVVNLVKPFIINDKLGIDALKEHLKDSKELIELSDSEWEGSTDSFINHIVDTATVLQKVYNTYNDFAPTVLDLQNENATQKDKDEFYNLLADKYVNTKSTEFHIAKELSKQEESRDQLLAEKGRSRGDITDNPMLHKELRSSDLRYRKIDDSITELNQSLIEAKKETEKLWDEKNLNKQFAKSVKDRIEIEKEKEKTAQVDAVLAQIKEAKTEKEVDDITIPDGVAAPSIAQAKKWRKDELKVEKDIKDKTTSSNNDTYNQEKKTKDLKAEEALTYVQDNYNEGEEITVDSELGLEEKYTGETAKVKSITKDGVEFEFEDGTTAIASIENTKKTYYSNNANYSSEGGPIENTQTSKEDTESGTKYEKRGDSRIMSSDNKGGVLFGNEAALEFEQSPRDKVGEEKTIEMTAAKDEVLSTNQLAALTMFKNGDFTNIDFLIDHLPLSVKLSEGVTAPLGTKSETSDAYNKVFNETTRHIRETIIKEVVNNNAELSTITAPIAGQWNGQLQIAPKENGVVVENPISGLYEFAGDISKIKSTDFYMVDDFGFLKNTDGKTLPTAKNKANAKGEIYLAISMANGKQFPLKLNVKKISTEQADTLFDIYKFLAPSEEENREVRIDDLEDKELAERIKSVFKNEIELFAKNKKSSKRVTIGDIVSTMIYSSSNPKSQVRFIGDKLYVTDKVYTVEDLNTPETKQEFIDIVSSIKRQQIKFKKHKIEGKNDFHFENRSYIEYLLENNILNTNAVIGKPTFAGRTSIYLDTKNVKVNGVESQYNSDVPIYMSETLVGNNTQLEEKLPGLFKNPVQLNKEGTHYVSLTNPKEKYSRVSTLKDSAPNTTEINVYNAAKRGDVVDELIRQFFSNPYFKKSEFIKQGKVQVKKINKSKADSTITIEDQFFGQLFNILETYKTEFEKRNWTVYANSPSLAGKIGKELFAGTGDLLVYDNTKSEWMFIDIKTSSKNRAEYYEGKDPYGYKKKDAVQQNAYRELFKQLTGVEVSRLLILPLTTKSEDPGVNSEYKEISIGLTKANKKLLIVDTSKDIYELIGKKKTPIKKVETEQFEPQDGNEALDALPQEEPENPLDLSAFGIEIPAPKKKAVPKQAPKTVKGKLHKLTREQELEALGDVKKPGRIDVTYEGKEYVVTAKSFYIFNTKGQLITNIPTILNIIAAYNRGIFPEYRINVENVRKIWNSRINVVPLQKKGVKPTTKPTEQVEPKQIKKVDTLDFSKLTDLEVDGIINNLMTAFPSRIKDIAGIVSKKISKQEMAKQLYSVFENNAIAKESIETKCKKG